MITKRPRRLRGVSYIGMLRYSLTICTACRRDIFASADAVAAVLAQLRQLATLFEFAVVAYCFMPDHLHLLIAGQSEQSDLCEFVRRFKQVTAFAYRQAVGDDLWQPGYHERVLRDDEATLTVARYILANPVRAGLATEVGEYPFVGSEVYDAKELLTAWERT